MSVIFNFFLFLFFPNFFENSVNKDKMADIPSTTNWSGDFDFRAAFQQPTNKEAKSAPWVVNDLSNRKTIQLNGATRAIQTDLQLCCSEACCHEARGFLDQMAQTKRFAFDDHQSH